LFSLPWRGLCPIISGCPTNSRAARQLQYIPKTEGNKDDEEPSSDEDGKAPISWLLYSLCGISLLFFAYGLICLTLRYPYIVTPIAFFGAVLFSIMAFRSKPKKETSKKCTPKNYQPSANIRAAQKGKEVICKAIIPKEAVKNTKETEKHNQNTNDSNNNIQTTHYAPPISSYNLFSIMIPHIILTLQVVGGMIILVCIIFYFLMPAMPENVLLYTVCIVGIVEYFLLVWTLFERNRRQRHRQ